MALPDKTFMLATLKRALEDYDEALTSATVIQKFVWQSNPRKFVVEAKPLDALTPETVNVLTAALCRMIRLDAPAETALRYAKRLHKPRR